MELFPLMDEENWSEVLHRIESHPQEVQSRNNEGDALPIHWCCMKPNVPVEVIKSLIDAYPESLRHITSYGALPLHCAMTRSCSSTQSAIIDVLLKYYQEGVCKKDHIGDTPLTNYLQWSRPPSLDIIKRLVDASPSVVRIVDACQWVPLHHAVDLGYWEISQYLIQCYPEALLKQDYSNRTPRDIANENDHQRLRDRLLQEEQSRFGSKQRKTSNGSVEELQLLSDTMPTSLQGQISEEDCIRGVNTLSIHS